MNTFLAWLGSSFLGRLFLKQVKDKLTKLVIEWAAILKVKAQQWLRKEKQDSAKVEYDKIMNDPNSTAQARAEAYAKYHNSGRT